MAATVRPSRSWISWRECDELLNLAVEEDIRGDEQCPACVWARLAKAASISLSVSARTILISTPLLWITRA